MHAWQALHMRPEAFYGRPWSLQAGAGMQYTTYTGSSFDLYPSLLQHVDVLIYNGDGERVRGSERASEEREGACE